MTQQPLTLELWSPELPRDFVVTRFTGFEAMSECFDFALEFTRGDEEVDVEACLRPGTRAAISFKRNEEIVRVMHGCLVEFGAQTSHEEPEQHVAHTRWFARFAPRVWNSKLSIRTEVYEGSPREILTEVLQRSGLYPEIDFEFRLVDDYPRREFVLQYHESDYAFISRLLEHWGIAFTFEHGTRDRLIFSDQNAALLDIACWKRPEEAGDSDAPENPGAERDHVTTLPYRQYAGGEGAGGSSVASHSWCTKRVPASFMTHDYNYRLPHVRLEAECQVLAAGDGRVVEHGLHLKAPAESAHFARIRAELLGINRVLHQGTTSSLELRAGGSFSLFPDPDGNETRLLVHRVEHRLREGYSARFHALPLEVAYRPALLTPKPRIAGYLSGVVQGDDAAQPNIDDQGRYQVALDCDSKQPGERCLGRPMRMLQMHAGPNYGMHFPLKPGTEVAVGFMNGDPDRPFIAGALPNPLTPSPVRGERGNARRNVIQSMSGVQIELDDGNA
ncbi:MAG: contractile injection system protein, VgrG/Pvc8 family [Polyangiaceae bacterium]